MCFFLPPPFYSAAAQHLRMQNEQASETVAMVIVTRLIVTRILIKAHTATRLLGRPSRWKQQQLMASLLNRVSGCTLFLTSWRCLTDSCTRHCLYFMHREHAWCFFKWRPTECSQTSHGRGNSALLLDAGSVILHRFTLQTAWAVFQRWHGGTRVEGRW